MSAVQKAQRGSPQGGPHHRYYKQGEPRAQRGGGGSTTQVTQTDRVQKCTLCVGGAARESLPGSFPRNHNKGGVCSPKITHRRASWPGCHRQGGQERRRHRQGGSKPTGHVTLGGPGPGNCEQRGVQSTNVTEMGNVVGMTGVEGGEDWGVKGRNGPRGASSRPKIGVCAERPTQACCQH